MKLRQAIWGDNNPFRGVEFADFDVDVQGWRRDHSLLLECAKRAETICEVGVGKGASIVDMAKANPTAEFLAVDTWRGSAEHWLNPNWRASDLASLSIQFRRNMLELGLSDRVTPLPLDSVNAFELCRAKGLSFDLVHIDAGHDFMSCYTDLSNWSPIAKEVVVDDYCEDFPEVVRAVDQYIENNNIGGQTSMDGKIRFSLMERRLTEPLLEGADVV